MTDFRRQVLDGYSPFVDTNAGLWLDKYLLNDNAEAKKNLVYQVFETIKLQEAYRNFYTRWEEALTARGAVTKPATTLGRLAVNLGAEATLENSIALNRTYGTPYIPGSALKGLAANYARNSLEGWNENTQAYKDIFGTQDMAGYVNFYDALYMPVGKLGLVPDVVAVHHQEYYQKDGVPPADWDSPIPIHFLSASGTFLIALSGPSEKLVRAAYDILALALAREGVGAKTNSGYGRMQVEGYGVDGKPEKKKEAGKPQVIPAGYQSGVVKNVKESYAFIQPEKGGKDVFVHFNDLTGGLKALKEKQRVFFKTKPGRNLGEVQAVDVRLAE